MEKREGELKSAFLRELHARLPGFYAFQLATAAMPDRGIAGAGRTTFWEFKHGTPDFDSPGNQELMCMRLAQAAHCRYVIWQEGRAGQNPRTLIVTPRNVHERDGWRVVPEAFCLGFNHKWLVDQVRLAHLGRTT